MNVLRMQGICDSSLLMMVKVVNYQALMVVVFLHSKLPLIHQGFVFSGMPVTSEEDQAKVRFVM